MPDSDVDSSAVIRFKERWKARGAASGATDPVDRFRERWKSRQKTSTPEPSILDRIGENIKSVIPKVPAEVGTAVETAARIAGAATGIGPTSSTQPPSANQPPQTPAGTEKGNIVPATDELGRPVLPPQAEQTVTAKAPTAAERATVPPEFIKREVSSMKAVQTREKEFPILASQGPSTGAYMGAEKPPEVKPSEVMDEMIDAQPIVAGAKAAFKDFAKAISKSSRAATLDPIPVLKGLLEGFLGYAVSSGPQGVAFQEADRAAQALAPKEYEKFNKLLSPFQTQFGKSGFAKTETGQDILAIGDLAYQTAAFIGAGELGKVVKAKILAGRPLSVGERNVFRQKAPDVLAQIDQVQKPTTDQGKPLPEIPPEGIKPPKETEEAFKKRMEEQFKRGQQKGGQEFRGTTQAVAAGAQATEAEARRRLDLFKKESEEIAKEGARIRSMAAGSPEKIKAATAFELRRAKNQVDNREFVEGFIAKQRMKPGEEFTHKPFADPKDLEREFNAATGTEAKRVQTDQLRRERIASLGPETMTPWGKVKNLSPEDLDRVVRALTMRPPTAPEAKPAANQIYELPLNRVAVEPERFQPRIKGLNEDLQQERMANFNRKLTENDPIKVWLDPKDNTYKVLVGHHRHDLFTKMGEKTVPAIVFEGTEQEAIDYAHRENADRGAQTPMDNATRFRKMIESGRPISEVTAEAKSIHGRNHTHVMRLARLDPKGKLWEGLNAIDPNSDAGREMGSMAGWIGQVKTIFPELTNSHERELFDHLTQNYKERGHGFTSMGQFQEYIEKILGPNPDYTKPLNLDNFVPRSQSELEYDRSIADKRKELADAEAKAALKRQDLLNRRASDADYARIMQPLTDESARVKRELESLLKNRDNVISNIRQSEISLFGQADDAKEVERNAGIPEDEIRKADEAGDRDARGETTTGPTEPPPATPEKPPATGGPQEVKEPTTPLQRRPQTVEERQQLNERLRSALDEKRILQRQLEFAASKPANDPAGKQLVPVKVRTRYGFRTEEQVVDQTYGDLRYALQRQINDLDAEINTTKTELARGEREMPHEQQSLFERRPGYNVRQMNLFTSKQTQEVKTSKGETIRFQSARAAGLMGPERTKPSSYRPLQPGEKSYLERKYEKYKQLRFTKGRERTETAADVAYINKTLEDQTTEHLTLTHVNAKGQEFVQHVSTGSYSSTIAEPRQAADAINRFGTVKLWQTHNHPSTTHPAVMLRPSSEDLAMIKVWRAAFPKVDIEGVIVDGPTGEYITYGAGGMISAGQRAMTGPELPVKALTFSKQVYKEAPEFKGVVTNAKDVAQFISAQQFSSGEKLRLLSLNSANGIVGHFFLSKPFGAYEVEELRNEITGLIGRSAGTTGILSGNVEILDNPGYSQKLRFLRESLSSTFPLLDFISVEPSGGTLKGYASGAERGVMEPQATYGEKKPEELAPPWYSRTERLLDDKLPVAAPVEQVRNILKGAPQQEVKWTGLDDFLAEKKGKVTKQEVMDYLRENAVQVKEKVLSETSKAGELTKVGDKTWRIGDYFIQQARDAFHVLDREGARVSDAWFASLEDARDAIDAVFGKSPETLYGRYVLPGAKKGSYRELLLQLPTEEKMFPTFDDWYAQGRRDNPEAFNLPFEELPQLDQNDAVMEYQRQKDDFTDKSSGTFRSGHFDEPNVLAHVRFNERADTEGKRVLFMEELQSDWHQRGRRQGYQTTKKPEPIIITDIEHGGGVHSVKFSDGSRSYVGYRTIGTHATDAQVREYFANILREKNETLQKAFEVGVPDAPFKSDWHELAMRRMLRYAAEHGFDKLAWTTGAQQAERYDLSKQVKSIIAGKNADGTYNLTAHLLAGRRAMEGGDQLLGNHISPDKLPDYVGKDLASKIVAGTGKSEFGPASDTKMYSGVDLRVGGEGMKGFYDKILPDYMNKYGKKWGAKVGTTDILSEPAEETQMGLHSGATTAIHSVDITPSMRHSVLYEGQHIMEPGAQYIVTNRSGGMDPPSQITDLRVGEPDDTEFRRQGREIPRFEEIVGMWRDFIGKTFPRMARVEPRLGDLGASWANSHQTAQFVSADFADRILSTRVDDKLLGAVFTEDRLRGIKDRDAAEIEKLGAELGGTTDETKRDDLTRQIMNLNDELDRVKSIVGAPGSPLSTEADFERAINDPKVKQAIDIYKREVEPYQEEKFKKAAFIPDDEELAKRGKHLPASMSLFPVDPNDPSIDKGAVIRFGSGPGSNLPGSLRRRTVLAQRAKGTAEQYSVSFRDMLRNQVAKTLSLANKKTFEDALLESGNAKMGKPGQQMDIKGEPTREFAIRRGRVNQSIYVRQGLSGEYWRLENRDDRFNLGVGRHVARLFNQAALSSLLEPTAHGINLLSLELSKPGVGADAVRAKMTAIGGLPDIAVSIEQMLRKDPEAHKQRLAELSDMGVSFRSPHEVLNPYLRITGKAIHAADLKVRLVLDDAFSYLVKKGLAQDTPMNRREFINQAGVYNRNVYGKVNRFFKDTGLSPFITATRAFTVSSVKNILLQPGAKAPSAVAAAKLRATMLNKIVGTVALISVLNYLTTKDKNGGIGGRQGTPLLTWDTGLDFENGDHVTIDVGRFFGLSRGLRSLGVKGYVEGRMKGLSEGQAINQATRDITNSGLSMISGPAVRFGTEALTGYQPAVGVQRVAPVVAPGESQMFENVKTAATEANPVISFLLSPKVQTDETRLKQTIPFFTAAPSEQKVRTMPKRVQGAELSNYIDDLSRRSRQVPRAQRYKFVQKQVADLPGADRAKVLRELLMRRRILIGP